MPPQRHVIQKVILDLHLPSAGNAFNIQNEISRLFRRELVPVIETCLNEYSHPDSVHRIPTLQVDLDRIEPGASPAPLRARLAADLKQQLAQCFPAPSDSLHAQAHATDRATANAQLITHFIKTGRLPWWAEKLSVQDLGQALEDFIAATPAGAIEFLLEIAPHPDLVKRLASQFPTHALFSYAKLFFPNDAGRLSDIIHDLSEILKSTAGRSRTTKAPPPLIYQAVFCALGNPSIPPEKTRRFAANVLAALAAKSGPAPHTAAVQIRRSILDSLQSGFRFKTPIIQAVEAPDNDPPIKQPAHPGPSVNPPNSAPPDKVRKITEKTQHTLGAMPPGTPLSALKKMVRQRLRQQLPADKLPIIDDILDAVLKQHFIQSPANPSEKAAFTDKDELYVHNAGLIITWPFLTRFFERLKLVHEKQFIDARSQHRAVLLLQYLTDSSIHPPEYLLPLNKFLCALPLEEPVGNRLNIGETEIMECRQLLASIISNWEILKNTSVTGFQQTFLQREGILRTHHGAYTLTVEGKAYDAVMEKLPYSIHLVKLPWMNCCLYVDWQPPA